MTDAGETPGPTAPRRHFFGFDRLPPIEFLRIGAGAIWLANFIFILDPANDYWSSFSRNALSFAPTTIGGPGLAQYVSAHPLPFSWAIALVTAYLTVSFLLGLSTRAACLIGSCFSGVLLATQFGSTFFFPGGTDVGEHPLYILIYMTLVLGGAGESLSLDHVLAGWVAHRRAARVRVAGPVPSSWTTSISPRTLFVYAVAGTLLSFGVGLGLVVAIPVPSNGGGTGVSGPTHYVNLSINLNQTNGWPQYTPANFSVPSGRVVFTIVDNDSPVSWPQCPCVVSGVEGGVEYVNGSPIHTVSTANVAHTFDVPNLNLAVYTPGATTTRFTVDLINPGQFLWFCFAPCGAGTNPYSTPPMGTAGYMTGTMTIVSS